jgi:hypothetical protein
MCLCIYPGVHGAMSPEHYLPAALGTFEGCEPLQDRVCRVCNGHIGNQTETQFLRAGPIAFFRWMVGIEGRDGLPPSPFHQGAGGAPRLVMLGKAPDAPYDILCEIEWGAERAFPMRQIVVDGGIAGIHPIAITDRMRTDPVPLTQELEARGLTGSMPLRVIAGPEDVPWITGLLRAIGATPPAEWTTLDCEPQRQMFVVTTGVTDAYFRAVAKIVFHYALKMVPELTGAEPEFASIRDFIWSGGTAAKFVRQRPDQFVENFRRGARPTHWMHLLAVVRSYERIVGYAQFFAGPGGLPPPFEIWIGRDPSRIVRPVERRAHQFVILNPGTQSGLVGRMEDAQPAHLVWRP